MGSHVTACLAGSHKTESSRYLRLIIEDRLVVNDIGFTDSLYVLIALDGINPATCTNVSQPKKSDTPGKKKVIVKIDWIVEEPRVACPLSRSVHYQWYQKLSGC